MERARPPRGRKSRAREHAPIVATLFACLASIGCDGPSVRRFDASIFPPDSGDPTPNAPEIDRLPTRIPYSIATVRGRAIGARRVVLQGAGNPIATQPLPDGRFCFDVRLVMQGPVQFTLFAQNSAGVLSPMAVAATEYDAGATPIPGATTCSGDDPIGCASAVENCTNGQDDDCNGLSDSRDPACAECANDAFEPNDMAVAPRVAIGRHDGLKICPRDNDYFGIYLTTGQTLRARAFFTDIEIVTELLGLDHTTVLVRGASSAGTSTLAYTATADGVVTLRAYTADLAIAEYALQLDVTDP